jgi:hypothetical protein
MLRIQLIGLALVSAVAMCALAAGSASAENWQWLLYHSETGVHLLLSKEELVESLGILLLEDQKGLAAGAAVVCHGYDLGTVGPHGLDLVLSITLEPLGTKKSVLCTLEKAGGCKAGTSPTAEALNLPWHTLLFEREGKVRDLILEDGGGRPGWKVTCTNLIGGTTEDDCKEEAGKPASTVMTNAGLEGVLAEFNPAENPKAECSVGGKEAGIVKGTSLTESPSPTLLILISPLP